MNENATAPRLTRRRLIGAAGIGGLALAAGPAWAGEFIDLALPGGPSTRPLTRAFPQKGTMVLQRTRPPLLETPWDVFDDGVFTSNDRFYVRWHWAVIPTSIDVESFRLKVRGHVAQPLSLTLHDILALPRVELAAVNQCSGNSRGYFLPRVPGGEWGNGAMGNAVWTGVRLRDVLDRAGVKSGAVEVRFRGLDEPVVAEAPHFMKSLALDHARDGEVMLAFAMNNAPLPLLNGFPLRLVVPGWYATYWVKMVADIDVLAEPDRNFWTASAYKIPDTPHADMKPGEVGVPQVPINRMVPRSFITNLAKGAEITAGRTLSLRGIAFGGDCGVAAVEFSSDGGSRWDGAELGPDHGKYSFRQWQARFTPSRRGRYALMVRCRNEKGEIQPTAANWNPSGFMRNVVESLEISAV